MAKQKDATTEYTADSIQTLDQRTHLLKRLSLTFGSETGDEHHKFSSQKTTALREIQDNSIDEVVAGHGTHVRIAFYKDGSFEVADSGRGLPVDVSQDGNGRPVSGVYKALGIIQSGGKFSADSNRFSAGMNGVGASSTVATSKRTDVTVYRNNKMYSVSFHDGKPGFFSGDSADDTFTELDDYSFLKVEKDPRTTAEKKVAPTGTTVRVWLRDEVFQSDYPFDHQDLIARLRGTSFLLPQMYVDVYNELNMLENPETGELEPQRESYHFEDGILDLIRLNQPDEPLIPVLEFSTEGSFIEKNVPVLQEDGTVKSQDLDRRVPIHLALSYGSGYETHLSSFVNTINTKLGGVHETAFLKAMTKAFNERFSSMRGLMAKGDEAPLPEDFQEGLTAVLSIQVSEPQFTSQSKEQLSGREVQKSILESLTETFESWIKNPANSNELAVIAKKVTTAAKNRQKAREQRDLNRKKNEVASSSLPAKLNDCELSGTEDAELYICEGDSARTSLKAARDGRVNALLPIRGKIINSHRTGAKEVLANAEVQDIIKCLGAGFGKDFDIEKMRYGRVIIACDADADGGNIACLIYALFWNFFRDVILQGRLYKMETPLFVISPKKGKDRSKIYCRDERERDHEVAKLDKNGITYVVQRMKGLGEMDAPDLHIAAISPDTRILTQVSVSDVETAQDVLDMVLGDDADRRKQWVEELAPSFDAAEVLGGE